MMKWCLFVLLLVGCQESSKPNPRGLLGPDGEPLTAKAPNHVAPSEPSTPPAEKVPAFQALPSDPVDPGALMAPTPAAPVAEPAKPQRDLAAELARLIPSPSECMDLGRAAQQGKLSITVTAMVLPSGRLNRVVASAPGQPSESTKCIERRVAQGTLPPDVPAAPIQVEANLSVEVVAQAEPAAPAQPPKTTLPPTPAAPVEVAQPENGEVAQPDGTEFAQPSQ